MNDASVIIYVLEECPFCERFIEKESPRLFKRLVEETIPYDLIVSTRDILLEKGITEVPCIVYRGVSIVPRIANFTVEGIMPHISRSEGPVFSGIPTPRSY